MANTINEWSQIDDSYTRKSKKSQYWQTREGRENCELKTKPAFEWFCTLAVMEHAVLKCACNWLSFSLSAKVKRKYVCVSGWAWKILGDQ